MLFQIFSKNVENAYVDQRLKCPAPKHWLKNTTNVPQSTINQDNWNLEKWMLNEASKNRIKFDCCYLKTIKMQFLSEKWRTDKLRFAFQFECHAFCYKLAYTHFFNGILIALLIFIKYAKHFSTHVYWGWWNRLRKNFLSSMCSTHIHRRFSIHSHFNLGLSLIIRL